MNNYIQHCNNYRIRKLSLNETIKSFDCGDPDLNDLTVLLSFIKRFFFNDNKTGCRFITVDAYSNAVSFYERNKFQHLRNDDEPQNVITHLLYYDLNDIAV